MKLGRGKGLFFQDVRRNSQFSSNHYHINQTQTWPTSQTWENRPQALSQRTQPQSSTQSFIIYSNITAPALDMGLLPSSVMSAVPVLQGFFTFKGNARHPEKPKFSNLLVISQSAYYLSEQICLPPRLPLTPG